MKMIDRYVAREFLRLYGIFIISAPLLFVIGDWTDNVGKYAEQGLPVSRVALSYVYQMPLFISWSMPVAALIATVFTVSNMTRHSEMTAAKAGGMSFFRVLAMLPVLGILLTGVGLAITELVPITTAMNREVLGQVEPRSDQMRHEFVYAGGDGHIYTIRRLSMAGRNIGGLTIERNGDRDDEHAPIVHISAREATWDTITRGWTLRDGFHRTFVGDDLSEHTFRFTTMQLRTFSETPEQLMARAKDPEEMRYGELGHFIDTLERSGGRPLKLMVERAQKIAIPAATLIIILFGAPLANTSARGGAAYGIGISLGITVVYMMMFRLTGAAGAAGMMDPLHAAWIPNVVFFLAAVGLLMRVRT
jgi:lipopolysaccharide export system permease protein